MRHHFRYVMLLLVSYGVANATPVTVKRQPFTEGQQYQRVDPPEPRIAQQGRVEVVEMFLYACPHCYELDAKMRTWVQDRPYVDFHRVPAIIGPTWADQARAFYIARELGKADALDAALFKVIHEGGEQIYNEYAVVKFFTEQGYDRQKIVDLYRSPEIAAAVNEARRLTVKYGLRGVPAVIVNGEYVTAPYFVRNQEEMLDVLDSLLEEERARLTTNTTANN